MTTLPGLKPGVCRTRGRASQTAKIHVNTAGFKIQGFARSAQPIRPRSVFRFFMPAQVRGLQNL